MNDYALTYWEEKTRQREERVREFAAIEDIYRMAGIPLDPTFHIQARHAAKKLDVALDRLGHIEQGGD